MLAQRVFSAIVLAPLLIWAVASPGYWFLAAAVGISVLANWEFYTLLRRAGFAPLWPFGIVLSVAFILGGYLQAGQASAHVFAVCLTISLIYLLVREKLDGSLLDWAVTWLPPLYSGFMLSYLVSLRGLPMGDRWVYLVLGTAWSTDTAAYFVGRAIGRHPFFQRISPHKTMEGAVGGLAGGVLCGGLLAWYFGWDPFLILPLAVLASIAAELGDLAESFIKRQLGAKDASRIIPGHGGMLDRFDSVIFVGIVTYFWALWIGGVR